MDIQERFEIVAKQLREKSQSYRFGGPVSEMEITEAENHLGVRFPESYKLFLREFGFAFWPDIIYGLGARCRSTDNVVVMTQDERTEVEPKMRHHLVAFSPDGAGNHYCLDTLQMTAGECPVVFWNHEDDEYQQLEQTHASFLDWLEEQIQWRLDYDSGKV